MSTPGTEHIAIFAAGFAAAVVNSVAGGGTLITFPVLLWAGRDPIAASATNSLALWPGSLASAIGYRREIARAPRLLGVLLPAAVVGSLAGGILLLKTPAPALGLIAPSLILVATVLLALQRPVTRLLRGRGEAGAPNHAADTAGVPSPAPGSPPNSVSTRRTVALFAWQLVVSIYGGYFGAGMGILMLAALGVYGLSDIHHKNGLKNVLAAVINGVAGIYFFGSNAINPTDALVLVMGTIAGGYGGASIGRRLKPVLVERIVIGIGVGSALTLIVKRLFA
jgi:uncharacterized membrane protein YfcA